MNQSDGGIDLKLLLGTTPVKARQPGVDGQIHQSFRTVMVQIPVFSLIGWQKQEPNRFIECRAHGEAGFLRERGDENAYFEFVKADSPPSADWFRPSAREAAWFFAQGHGQALDFLGGEFLIETSSTVLMVSHFYIRENTVLLKVADGKLAFLYIPTGGNIPNPVHPLWRRRLRI